MRLPSPMSLPSLQFERREACATLRKRLERLQQEAAQRTYPNLNGTLTFSRPSLRAAARAGAVALARAAAGQRACGCCGGGGGELTPAGRPLAAAERRVSRCCTLWPAAALTRVGAVGVRAGQALGWCTLSSQRGV